MRKRKIKSALTISLLCAIFGALQMYWFLPDGLSCIDAKSGVVEAIFKFMGIQFLVVFFIQLILKSSFKLYVIAVSLCFFWFFINKNEFTYRYACWSTFSSSDILYYSFKNSIAPIITCLTVLILSIYFYKSKSKY
ncbi:hypothetical protein [Saccharicrinis aurantiacus]|uniref:hypothetical protein n=1 Tax=Saccharicrinis aurantiacus TaxID=1849719 RepID=UPI00094FB729|nr:hypothetical protein [Saccharicrinis aurantiacus]